jgi:AraC family transcriptional regulator, regulatory protein of adaptative response / DNA-3-methyladenine glycosylase II
VSTQAIVLPALQPFDGDSVLSFLAARAVAGVEEVIDATYRRSLALSGGGGWVALTADAAEVRCELGVDDPADAGEAVERCRRLFDLGADPAPIRAVLEADPLLAPLVRRRPGVRVPGAADGFEVAVRAIVGQQVSVAGARTVLGRLVARFGEPLAAPQGTLTHRFPAPEALAELDPGTLPFPRARGLALRELARLAAAGELRLEPGPGAREALKVLASIPGVGPWTTSYVAMRALGDPDVFLAGDVGVRNALERLGPTADPERWRPWRSYAVIHLWRSLDD